MSVHIHPRKGGFPASATVNGVQANFGQSPKGMRFVEQGTDRSKLLRCLNEQWDAECNEAEYLRNVHTGDGRMWANYRDLPAPGLKGIRPRRPEAGKLRVSLKLDDRLLHSRTIAAQAKPFYYGTVEPFIVDEVPVCYPLACVSLECGHLYCTAIREGLLTHRDGCVYDEHDKRRIITLLPAEGFGEGNPVFHEAPGPSRCIVVSTPSTAVSP